MFFRPPVSLISSIALLCSGACFIIIINLFRSESKFSNGQCSFDKKLISEVQQRHLFHHDPNKSVNYSLWAPQWGNKQKRMSHFVISRLNNKTGGFFIECGAFDGLSLSNTLLLEKQYKWTGLLIEADPVPQAILKSRNRHAWIADVCLSPSATPLNITMSVGSDGQWNAESHIENEARGSVADGKRKFMAECYPLSVLLDAIGVNYVDYFSLDVEGVELDILKTIPFHRIKIKIISVEFRDANRKAIQSYLESVGYQRIFELIDVSESIHDDVYELTKP